MTAREKSQEVCLNCKGTGKVRYPEKEICEACDGSGYIEVRGKGKVEPEPNYPEIRER
jgi:DnaJ-class molecular chaperone